MDIKQELEALHSWKAGGRGETMMSTFDYNSSHDKMFIEGFREGIECAGKWHNLEENPNDLPDDDRDVLVMHKSGICYRVAKYYKYKKYWWSNDMDSELGCIARWKELE